MSNATKPKKPKGRGGAREGAGRPPLEGGTKPLTIRVSGELLQALEAEQLDDETLNMTVKRLLRWQLEALEADR